MENNEPVKNPIQVADKLFSILETLAYQGPMGLQDLSVYCKINKSTTHRTLNSLLYMGYVKQDSTTLKYRLSFKIWELASQLTSKLDIIEITRPVIKELVLKISETVHLVCRDGNNAVYIDKVESYSNTIRMASKVGSSIPLYCSAVGKALLAGMSDTEIAHIWNMSELSTHTEHTIIDFSTFMDEIEVIRKLGYALDNEENEKGVRCIAVALSTQTSRPTYAFSISAPIDRMSDLRISELAPEVLLAKQQMQERL